MLYLRLLWAQFAVAGMVAILHIAALQWDLYFYYFWLDMVTHTLGGVFIALATAWLMAFQGRSVSVTACIFSAFAIGVGWEIFEYVFHLPQTQWIGYPLDTAKDICMDCIGGALGGFCATRFLLK